ncbi:aldo/keto reductase [Streptosporangium lutulentum]|uniref:Aryl-alcohol dehydrogenase-like predicted oxidoreductase n=1 Tax=Streptosporangium lutulentum TaxID=1461250 RepID=A0ABT9Q848_9ACTN|nr:aldo/keto reductase [Streptosporangium lutulentum]MDP9842896.1 aryl-alcohol dehydrogenase-like predicted oxidoreductase [Streptosporangium lutulentum]
MRYRTLGRTGIQVSPYALGAMMFGALGNPDHDDSIRIIHKALDAGINFIDTADMYSHGESEEIVGKALKGRRDDVVLATKARFSVNHGPGGGTPVPPNRSGASRRWLIRALDDSLRRLGTDYVDLFQIHRPDPDTDIEETLSVLTDLVRAGKVRAVGTSSLPASDIVRSHWVAERRGLIRLRTEQPPYSILNRGIEREVLPVVQEYGMGSLVWSPLAGGLLTGRYRKNRQNTTHRSQFGFKHLSDERRLDAVEQLVPLAQDAGIPLTHLAMAFAIAHPGVTSAIIGPRTMEHLDDLLAGLDVTLTDKILDRIDEIVPPGTDIGTLDMAYDPPAIEHALLRRRPVDERAAA